jgi:hypothetical protein
LHALLLIFYAIFNSPSHRPAFLSGRVSLRVAAKLADEEQRAVACQKCGGGNGQRIGSHFFGLSFLLTFFG